MTLICDTGPLLAGLDAADPDHEACARLLRGAEEDLVLPSLVLAELDRWCHERLTAAAWLIFLGDVLEGAYRVEHPTNENLRRCRALQETYADLELGIVDVSIVALLERLGEPKVGTLDHRHFATIRPQHVDALTLLPDREGPLT